MSDKKYPEEKALQVWEYGGATCSIVRHGSLGHLCGYARFSERPTREEGYNGILTYVPVHGGLTFAKQSEDGSMVYGFDCGHSGDSPPPEFQRGYDYEGHVWTEDEVKAETEIMIDGIKAAVEIEADYLLAKDSQAKADIIDKYHEKLRESGAKFTLQDNFGAMINALSGSL